MDPGAGQAMEWNDEGSEAFPDIFGNPVILSCILEHLPNSKLLELSFVSKFWKKEARIVMKKRGGVMALLEINGIRGYGQVLEAFVANMEALNDAMYSGMIIRLCLDLECDGTGALELERIHASMLAGMRGKLKRLSIELRYGICWINSRDCPHVLLPQLLLRDFIGYLEHLTLEIPTIMGPFEEFIPPGPYPKLKVLKLKDAFQAEETFGNRMRMLLSRAPHLKEIHTSGNISLRENLVEGREGVVHVHESIVHDPMRDIPENAINALRLKSISFFYNTEAELDRFNAKAQSFLRTCCSTTLESLSLDTVSAVLLMSYGIRLVKVEELRIGLDYLELEQFEPRILSILSRFDFTYLFPNLKEVDITRTERNLGEISRDTMNAIIEQANAAPMEPTLPRAANIKTLSLGQEPIPITAFQFFAHIFPAIEELSISGLAQDIRVESAWELWRDLK